jgi:hypothetical protein
MGERDPTYVGQVASVAGAVVRVRLRDDMPSALVLVDGESYRVGQIGAFLRIPLGYSSLFAVCTQVGADAAPPAVLPGLGGPPLEMELQNRLAGFRWMTVVLFGEGIGGMFERGVGQFPTVGDEVHLVTKKDLRIIYGWSKSAKGVVAVGSVASASGIEADINIAGLVTRHGAIVGSTGSGKSNLVTVLLEAIADRQFKSARAIVIDPHGEYSSALGGRAKVFKIRPNEAAGERALSVPFWALPFSELQDLTLGGLQPNHEAAIRDIVLDLKTDASKHLGAPPPLEAVTADSPVPFSIKKLWHDLDRFERMTFPDTKQESDANANPPTEVGDPANLKPTRFPEASPYNTAPYKNNKKRNIERQLELMRSRLRDSRFSFLFTPAGGFEPSLDGKVENDLDVLVTDWVGHDRPISVFDVSGLPSEVLPAIVGTMLRVIYDMLFWAQDLPVGGRSQPLLIVVDEAHRFIPRESVSPAHRTLATIAKEGRKYGSGLLLVTQRPSELDPAVLSQCGSLVALRLTNGADRAHVQAAVPDDLGGLIDQLPALRTGEALFLGEVMPIPSRVRVRKAQERPVGDDPKMPDVWLENQRPDSRHYSEALAKWRAQSKAAVTPAPTGQSPESENA